MANLKDLQEMAKSGEVSKKLLEDEEFKNELRKALKEENGAEITDEQISQIIRNFETALQSEGLLKNAEIENISGGRISKAKAIKGISALLGAATGFGISKKVGDKFGGKVAARIVSRLTPSSNATRDQDQITLMAQMFQGANDTVDVASALTLSGEIAGIGSGGYGGWKLGEYICKKFDIKD